MKLDWGAIGESVFVTHRAITAVIALAIVLVAVAAYMTDCGHDWSFNRGVKKTKQQIENKVGEIKSIETEIRELERQRDAKTGELKRDVEEFQESVFGLDEAKRETNRALANLNAASASNANVNASADDVLRQLEKLNQK